ncbi:MAG: OmpA family protein [Chitinophagaceae bacterium]|nr:OmpA family protein [Chitinophagaceae bacterium]
MKKSLLFALSALLLSSQLFSQRFVGFNTGNYAGITGVMLQPASIVDSRHKFDINLFSTDVRYSNNYFLLNRDVLLKFNKNNFDDYQTFRSKYLSEAQLAAGEKAFFNVSNRTQLLLSFMVTLSEKSALALNIQSRTMIQGRNISQDLAKLAFNNFYYQPFNNRSVDASNLSLQSLSWAEVGLTYGRVLLNSGNHFLKGAVTGKYLGGVSSFNLASNNLTVRVNNDSTFNFNTDRVNYNHNKNADLNRVFDTRFRPDANAFGADAGLVYEYRGHLNNFRYIRNDDEESYEVRRRDLNKYIFRLGVSLLDVGMFTFHKPDNANSFRADINNWDIRNSNYSSLREFDTALANRVTPLANDPREYNAYLPGALSVQMDIRFVKGLYLNALAYRPLKMGRKAGSRFDNYGYYSITPRFEKRHFGIYIPYTFSDRNDITDFRDNRLGLALKLGPVFFGSSNLGSMAFNKKLKAADFFVGLKVGFTYGKPSKVERLFTPKKQTSYDGSTTEKDSSVIDKEMMTAGKIPMQGDNKTLVNMDTATRKMILDYTKGQVYSDGKTGQVIVINNNYYYGTAGENGKGAVYDRTINSGYAQRNNYNIDSAMRINQAQKKKIDSANNVLRDSLSQKRQQLDTLINRLNVLRQKLDSTNKADSLMGYNREQNSPKIAMYDTTAKINGNRNTNLDRTDSLANVAIKSDTIKLAVAPTAKNEGSKKKVTTTSAAATQQNTTPSNRSLSPTTENVALISANNRAIRQQQTLRDDAYDNYIRQSERLQADIERLERQMTYNRSAAYTAAPVPYYNQPAYNNSAQQLPVSYPVIVPAAPQAATERIVIHDTLRIRDTVFLAAKDVATKTSVSIPNTVYVPVTTTKIVKEKIDYKNLPPENVLFGIGQSAIRQVYVQRLNYLANILRNNPELRISISGHTDKTGSPAANELLSLKRANAVKTFFVQKGINENRMQVTGVAAEDPLVEGNTKNAKMQNRRVEIKIL